MKITALFWNTWLDNYIDTEERRRNVEKTLNDLLEKFDPDVVGLNEVVETSEQNSTLLQPLRKYNHNIQYLPSIQLRDGRKMGNVLAARHPFNNYRIVDSGPNVLAIRHGFKNQRVQHLFAEITPDGAPPFTFGVVHLLPFYIFSIAEHFRQQTPIANAMKDSKVIHPAIIGGDFNEFKYMLTPSVRGKVRQEFNRFTGSYFNPTWTAYAVKLHPVRANYDHIYWSRKNDSIKLIEAQVIREHPSDHAPLIAKFELGDPHS